VGVASTPPNCRLIIIIVLIIVLVNCDYVDVDANTGDNAGNVPIDWDQGFGNLKWYRLTFIGMFLIFNVQYVSIFK